MKFGKFLEDNMFSDWEKYYVRYKLLKKMLSKLEIVETAKGLEYGGLGERVVSMTMKNDIEGSEVHKVKEMEDECEKMEKRISQINAIIAQHKQGTEVEMEELDNFEINTECMAFSKH